MKIITDNAIYIQGKDIGELLRSDMPMPGLISLLGNSSFSAFINNLNGEEFIRFTEEEECQFFMNQDWIIDFDEVKNLSVEELMELGKQIATEKNSIASKFNSLTKERKNEIYDVIKLECDLLEHKMYSVRDFIYIKNGLINVFWPEEIEIPENMINQSENIKNKTKPSILQLIKCKFKINK